MPLLITLPFGPLLAWKRGDLMGAAQRLSAAAALALSRRGDFAIDRRRPGAGAVRVGLAVFVMAGALPIWSTAPLSARRCDRFAARGLPRSAWATASRISASGVSLLGIVCAIQLGAQSGSWR